MDINPNTSLVSGTQTFQNQLSALESEQLSAQANQLSSFENLHQSKEAFFGYRPCVFIEGFLKHLKGELQGAQHLFSQTPNNQKMQSTLADFPYVQHIFGTAQSLEQLDERLIQWQQGRLDCELSPPGDINALFDRYFLERFLPDPEQISELGLLNAAGCKAINGFLTDRSFSAQQAQQRNFSRTLDQLQCYPYEGLSPEEKRSFDILSYNLTLEQKGAPFLKHRYQFDHMDGPHHTVSLRMTDFHKIEAEEDAENYLSRLKAVSTVMQQCLDNTQEQISLGIYPPILLIDHVLDFCQEQLRNHGSQPAQSIENDYYSKFQEKLSEAEFDTGFQESCLAQARDIIEQRIFAIYETMQSFFTDLKNDYTNNSRGNFGLHALPDGKAFYEHGLEAELTTSLSVEDIHQQGHALVNELKSKMAEILRRENIPGENLSEQMHYVGEHERFQYPDTEAGKEALLADFKKLDTKAHQKLGHFFGLKPVTQLDIRRSPPGLESGAGAYYFEGESPNGSESQEALAKLRPGTFMVNTSRMASFPDYSMATLLIHEGFPGHHLQLGVQAGLPLPTFRKTIPDSAFNAYVEGWALYVESFANEHGFYNTPLQEFGHYRDAMLRAVRLVVDTGIHTGSMSRDEAIAFMSEATGYPMPEVEAEIDRYHVYPGQACSYMIGKIFLNRQSDKWQQAFGNSAQSLKDFHDVVLSLGACPLAVVEQAVDQAITNQQHQKEVIHSNRLAQYA